RHHRAGKDVGVVGHRDLADDHGAGADEDAVADGRAAALLALAGDAEGHVLLDGAVDADRAAAQHDGAEARQVQAAADLGAARLAGLDFAKIARISPAASV